MPHLTATYRLIFVFVHWIKQGKNAYIVKYPEMKETKQLTFHCKNTKDDENKTKLASNALLLYLY